MVWYRFDRRISLNRVVDEICGLMQKLGPLPQDYHLCVLEKGQIPFRLQKSPHRLQTVALFPALI